MTAPLLLLVVAASTTAFAQNSDHFEITRSFISGGGATNSSSRFQLVGTVAQPLAAKPGGVRFSIQGGFWTRPAPIFFAPKQAGNNFSVSIQSELGENYTVEYANSLAPLTWQTLTNFTGNGSVMTVTNSVPGVTNRFYRLMQR